MKELSSRSSLLRLLIGVAITAVAIPSFVAAVCIIVAITHADHDSSYLQAEAINNAEDYFKGLDEGFKEVASDLSADESVKTMLSGVGNPDRYETKNDRTHIKMAPVICIIDNEGGTKYSSPKAEGVFVCEHAKDKELQPGLMVFWKGSDIIFGEVAPVRNDGILKGYVFAGSTLNRAQLAKLSAKWKLDIVIGNDSNLLASNRQVNAGDLYKRLNGRLIKPKSVDIEFREKRLIVNDIGLAPIENGSGLDVWAIIDKHGPLGSNYNFIYLFAIVFTISILAASIMALGLGLSMRENMFKPMSRLTKSINIALTQGVYVYPESPSKHKEIREIERISYELLNKMESLENASQKTAREIGVLYDMSYLVAQTTELWELANVMIDNALEISDADVAHLVLINLESHELELQVSRTREGIQRIDMESIIGNGIIDNVIRRREPLIFSSIPCQTKGQDNTEALSAICVPLIYGKKIEGVLLVGTKNKDIEYRMDDVHIMEALANGGAVAVENARVYEVMQNTYLGTVRALAAAIDAKDPFTHGHSERVARIVTAIAKRRGWSGQKLKGLETAAYLHDIGKLSIANEILLKKDKLDEDELTTIRRHPVIGANILSQVSFPWDIVPIIRHHHERYDGKGYPAGLTGTDIPEGSRILAVADVFESITADRPYRSGMSLDEARKEISINSGTQFDPDIVEDFLQTINAETTSYERESPSNGKITDENDELLGLRAAFTVISNELLNQFANTVGAEVMQQFSQKLNQLLEEQDLGIVVSDRQISTRSVSHGQEEQAEVYRRALHAQTSMMMKSLGEYTIKYFCRNIINALGEQLTEVAVKYGLDQACLLKDECPEPVC